MAGDILVTGATGFIGRHLCATLRQQGSRVIEWTRAQGDITSAQFPGGASQVVHLAARTFVPDSWNNPMPFYEVNVLGTANVAEYCRREGAALTLLSSYVYGRPEYLPIDEQHPVNAFNPYGQTKLMAESVATAYAKFHAVPVTIVRPFNVYGPGADSRFLISEILQQATNTNCAEIRVNDSRPRRDYLYVADLVSLIIATLNTPAAGLRIFNAGSGTSHSVAEIARMANLVTGQHKPLVSSDVVRPGEVPDMYASIALAAQALGWRPHTGLEDGMRATMHSIAPHERRQR